MGNSNGNSKPLPFSAPAGTPIIGQPFTMLGFGIPANVQFLCNCGLGPKEPLVIVLSTAVECPGCKRKWNAAFNPEIGKLQMMCEQPKHEVPN